jgi:hypothetical protein
MSHQMRVFATAAFCVSRFSAAAVGQFWDEATQYYFQLEQEVERLKAA